MSEKYVLLEDWKSGLGYYSWPEVVKYVFAATMLYPDYKLFRFDYVWVKSGERDTTWFRIVDDRTVEVTFPDGSTKTLTTRRRTAQGPIFAELDRFIKEIEKLPDSPNPGPHCENWYGRECFYKGTRCPIGKAAVEQVGPTEVLAKMCDDLLIPDADRIVATDEPFANRVEKSVASLPSEHQPGAAFVALHKGILPEESITQEIADLAYIGKKQIDAGSREVTNILKRWSKATGNPINYAGKRYGWSMEGWDINQAWALDLAWAKGLTPEDLITQGFVAITQSKVKKLPQKFAELKQAIQETCVERYSGDGRFGELPKDDEE